MSQVTVRRPFGELDLRRQLRPHPLTILRISLRERISVSPFLEILKLSTIEGADRYLTGPWLQLRDLHGGIKAGTLHHVLKSDFRAKITFHRCIDTSAHFPRSGSCPEYHVRNISALSEDTFAREISPQGGRPLYPLAAFVLTYTEEQTYRDLLGLLDDHAQTVYAECLFV